MGRLQGDWGPEGETVKIYERGLTVPHSAAPSIARITDHFLMKITLVLWQRVSPILLFVKITVIFWQHVSPILLFVKIILVFRQRVSPILLFVRITEVI